jgi:hypothetical protein
MQIENAAAGRRFRLLDAVIMVAATAMGILPVADIWPEVRPVWQKIEFARVLEPKYPPEEVFGGQMPSPRIARVRSQMAEMVRPVLGLLSWRDTSIDFNTRKPSREKWLRSWVATHAPPGAIGFAVAQDAFCLFFPFLLVWSLCLLCLRLLQPRPPWAALVRQPGWWASLGPILGVLLGQAEDLFLDSRASSSVIVPAIVLVAWVALAASRKWQAERSWIDRAGRILGVLWIATIPVYLIGFVFSS